MVSFEGHSLAEEVSTQWSSTTALLQSDVAALLGAGWTESLWDSPTGLQMFWWCHGCPSEDDTLSCGVSVFIGFLSYPTCPPDTAGLYSRFHVHLLMSSTSNHMQFPTHSPTHPPTHSPTHPPTHLPLLSFGWFLIFLPGLSLSKWPVICQCFCLLPLPASRCRFPLQRPVCN